MQQTKEFLFRTRVGVFSRVIKFSTGIVTEDPQRSMTRPLHIGLFSTTNHIDRLCELKAESALGSEHECFLAEQL